MQYVLRNLVIVSILLMGFCLAVQAVETQFMLGPYQVSADTTSSLELGRAYNASLGNKTVYIQEAGGNISFTSSESGPQVEFGITTVHNSTEAIKADLENNVKLSLTKGGQRDVYPWNIDNATIAGADAKIGRGVIMKYNNMPIRVANLIVPGSDNDVMTIVVYKNATLAKEIFNSLEIA